MVITLLADLEAALIELARERGVAAEILALEVIRDRLSAMPRETEE
jgi:hypothetical protein